MADQKGKGQGGDNNPQTLSHHKFAVKNKQLLANLARNILNLTQSFPVIIQVFLETKFQE